MPASLANHLFHFRGAAQGTAPDGARVASDKAQAHGTATRAPTEQGNTPCPHFPHCGIESRHELTTNPDAAAKFQTLRTEFDAHIGKISRPL